MLYNQGYKGTRQWKTNWYLSGLSSRASAACKPRENQPFTILKITQKSKPDPKLAIPLLQKNESI